MSTTDQNRKQPVRKWVKFYHTKSTQGTVNTLEKLKTNWLFYANQFLDFYKKYETEKSGDAIFLFDILANFEKLHLKWEKRREGDRLWLRKIFK